MSEEIKKPKKRGPKPKPMKEKIYPYAIGLNDTMLNKLKKQAKKNNTNISKLIREILSKEIKKWEKNK